MREFCFFGMLLLAWSGTSFASSVERWTLGKSTLTVHISPTPSQTMAAVLEHWVQTSAAGVAAYDGEFPVPQVDIRIALRPGSHIGEGVTYVGKRIEIWVGDKTPLDTFAKDWELTHEMFHLSFPPLDEDHEWLGEGLSDYLEPIARVANGTLSEDEAWMQLLDGLPQGLPEPGDEGLDHTHTWARTYWGGALYWFIADLEIRKQTRNRHSLRDAVRAILNAGGDGRSDWDVDQTLDVGDRATGTRVLRELHNQMADHAWAPDLPALWKELGIQHAGSGISYDPDAPLSKIRQTLMKGMTTEQKVPGSVRSRDHHG